ncbi:ABC transporter ATP-binding protein [Bifidobacterium primatium]|uniref:ABC transporter ATP-binding protein n=2 Tax=Bifidobacterium TaxID=1678 RepID=A0A2M9HA30_9BIFI|nr:MULTISPECIES: ABC transporter ATP-binding protein [Bifidobacterium]NEG95920.1 ATP-binding cassette domain-containing protein [Bifidobacterium sp. SMB2]NEH11767.1 ATP-binding cassette domain-containing protein [Bifidobacterium saimiriisciurei]PJM73670.1 ABC transporter ATP-binding protein [Bifidobacterium primatium]
MVLDALSGSTPFALSVNGVSKQYDSGFRLDDITFDLPAGYIMGLIGPNGAGKSTLIKLILNMVRRDAGGIEVLGLDNIADEERVKEQLGVVFDSGYFVEVWTVNKVEQAMRGLYATWNHRRFEQYCKRFGLDRRKKVKELSRGMLMKLMLAVALSHDARLLILDEPTSGLDVLSRDELMDILHEYIEDGEHTVLFSTHITSDLESAADFITYITHGRLYFTGPKDEFLDAFRVVKGGLADLDETLRAKAVGIHRYETGFDALLRVEDVKALAGDRRPQLLVEPAGIDDIIRLTNVRKGNAR